MTQNKIQITHFTRDDLILRPNHLRSIETKGELLSRLMYAAKVFNNKKKLLQSYWKPYKPENINDARQFLIKELQLPHASSDEVINQKLVSVLTRLEINAMQWLSIPAEDLHKPMPKVNSIVVNRNTRLTDAGWRVIATYLNKVNQDIRSINVDIASYNQLHDLEQKKELLEKIYSKKIAIEIDSPSDIVSCCQNYALEIHDKMNISIQTERSKLKQLSDAASSSVTNQSTLQLPSLSERDKISAILSNMSPEKLTKLGYLLLSNRVSESSLRSLFKKGELGYQAFQDFNNKNKIVARSGHHSQNFIIDTMPPPGEIVYNPNESMILKLGEQLNKTRRVEARLRNSPFNHHLIQISVERQVSLVLNGQQVIKTISITDFCPEGDLISHSAAKRAKHNDLETIKSAVNLYGQMAQILLDLSQLEAAFPDMKNKNWLVKNGKLLIADTKSFVATDSGMITTASVAKDQVGRASFLATPHHLNSKMIAFFGAGTPFSADEMHGYLLGRILFQYLTGCSDETLSSKSAFDRWSVFKLEEGIKLKRLIQDLQTKPSVQQALDTLNQIKLKLENSVLIDQLNAYQLAEPDIQLQIAIRQFKQALQQPSLQNTRELNNKLKQINATLEQHKNEINQLKTTIAIHCRQARTSQKIELVRSILNTPLMDRGSNASAHNNLLALFDKKREIKSNLFSLLGYLVGKKNEKIDEFQKNYHQKIDQASSVEQLDEVYNDLQQSWITCFKGYLNDELANIKHNNAFDTTDLAMNNFVQSFEQKIAQASSTAQLEAIRDTLQSSWIECLKTKIDSLKIYLNSLLMETKKNYTHNIKSTAMNNFVQAFEQRIELASSAMQLEKMCDELYPSWIDSLKRHLHTVLVDIKKNHALNENDRMMHQFVCEYAAEIDAAQEQDALQALEIKLTTIQQQLEKAKPGLKYILDKTTQYRDGYHYQGHAKAQLIEDALLNTLIEERSAIHNQLPVMDALAARRYRLFTRVKAEDSRNSKHLATAYKTFKTGLIDTEDGCVFAVKI